MVNITETVCIVVSLSVMSNSLRPHDHSSPGSSVHGDSPSVKTGVGCYALLQGIFPTQESNQDPLHCRWILYPLSYQGSPGTVYTEHFTRTGENRNWLCLGCRIRMLSQSADSLKLKKGQRMWCQKKPSSYFHPPPTSWNEGFIYKMKITVIPKFLEWLGGSLISHTDLM